MWALLITLAVPVSNAFGPKYLMGHRPRHSEQLGTFFFMTTSFLLTVVVV